MRFSLVPRIGLLVGPLCALSLAFPFAARAEPCGTVVAAGTTLTLTANVGPCDDDTNPAIVVEDGATLDRGGFILFCEDVDFGLDWPVGIKVNGTKATVLNGDVDNCQVGVQLGGEGKHYVEGVTASSRGMGFYVEAAREKNKLVSTNSFSNQNGYIIEGDKTSIATSNALENDGIGFQVSSHKNKLVDNVSDGNDVGAFNLEGEKNKLTGGSASDSPYGIRCAGEGCKVREVTVTGNAADGIEVERSAKVLGCTVSQNDVGIHVEGSALKPKIIGNSSTLNTTFDMKDDVAGCNLHVWKDNTFGTANETCIE